MPNFKLHPEKITAVEFRQEPGERMIAQHKSHHRALLQTQLYAVHCVHFALRKGQWFFYVHRGIMGRANLNQLRAHIRCCGDDHGRLALAARNTFRKYLSIKTAPR